MSNHVTRFLHDLQWQDLPDNVKSTAKLCLLDLLGVAASGTGTELSRITRNHVCQQFGPGASGARLLFDGRRCSPVGATLANGMTIDSIDAHDGYKPAKGHAGCGVLPAVLALLESESVASNTADETLLVNLVLGYEIACRAGVSLHDSVPDYHTSGAWVALAAAAIGARVLELDSEQTRHALGIAEYHGPRSQMMRCIDHPTMLKDGSGWGAMAGVSASYLAQSGFTGAPAISIEADSQAHFFSDLGSRWLITEQYVKPHPVCRWAQPAVVAALGLQQQHGFELEDIAELTIGSFHESVRLATSAPTTTEQAQYSLPFPVAVALHAKELTVNEIDGDGLHNTAVLAMSRAIKLEERDDYNQVFPQRRISDVSIVLKDGRMLESGPTEADGDPESPLSEPALLDKFNRFATPQLGEQKVSQLAARIQGMGEQSQTLDSLFELIYQPGLH